MVLRPISSEQKAFAEVIESSLQSFTAQCWQWNVMPQFGSLVIVQSGNITLFGIVHTITTGAKDAAHYPEAFMQTEEELMNEQPQIFALLKTTFTCLTIGYSEHEKIFYNAAPQPAKIHAFVLEASHEQYRLFFSKNRYLHLLFNQTAQLGSLDELLLAILKNLKKRDLLTEEKTSDFFEAFALLTGNDYRHLKLFLQRAHGIVQP